MPEPGPDPVHGSVPASGPSPALLAEEPLPLGVELTPTGHPAVDAGTARLEALDGVPTDAHVPVYEDVHQRLADTLAALDRD
ncbi:hypothetical protein [Streptomyces sp. BE20]|uniref:hypothetical protein n=1 Tax=Streptomycetaceae TaxID=2062 RepID=UPI002E77F58D|nr:hypothetical protein [Streptomyces sp. BE20]MEE1820693.1 hypothetical protein [Streptomyces sp. BE20]